MSQHKQLSIWDKLDPAQLGSMQKPASGFFSRPDESKWSRRRRLLFWRSLDALSMFLWAYTFARAFVGDVDRWLLGKAVPGLVWILDFRIFGFLLLASLLLLLVKRKYLWVPLYVIFFPLVLLCWNLPRFLRRRGSWTFALGVVHVLVSSVQGVRFTVVSLTVAAFACLAIVVSQEEMVLLVAAAALVLLWAHLLVRAFKYALSPARFVHAQQRALGRVLGSDAFWKLVSVKEGLRDPRLVRFDSEQANQLMLSTGLGLAGYRASQFWAFRLDEYRRSGASIVFSAAAIIGLLVQAVLTFTFVNGAIYKADPSQYAVDGEVGYPLLAYYSFASLFVNEISAMAPRGGMAAAAHLAGGFSTAVLVFILIATLFFGIKQSRTDESATAAIAEMRRRGDEFAARLSKEYEQPVEHLLRRFTDLGWDFFGILTYLAQHIPEPPLDREGRGRS